MCPMFGSSPNSTCACAYFARSHIALDRAEQLVLELFGQHPAPVPVHDGTLATASDNLHFRVVALSLPRYHGVIEPVVGQALVALDARIAERGVFVATEGENSLVHMLGVEHLESHEQVEILYRQTGHDLKQV